MAMSVVLNRTLGLLLGAAWTLEDDAPVVELSTVEGTPFSQTSNQLYYKTRPTISKANQVSFISFQFFKSFCHCCLDIFWQVKAKNV